MLKQILKRLLFSISLLMVAYILVYLNSIELIGRSAAQWLSGLFAASGMFFLIFFVLLPVFLTALLKALGKEGSRYLESFTPLISLLKLKSNSEENNGERDE